MSSETCLLCAHPIENFCVVDCSHSKHLCGECALRTRFFIERKQTKEEKEKNITPPQIWCCPFCKYEWKKVIITSNPHKLLSDYPDSLPYDEEIDAYFETEKLLKTFLRMRSIYCSECYTRSEGKQVRWFKTMKALEAHLQKDHDRYLCEACVSTRKVFPAEQKLFTKSGLIKHFRFGTKSSENEAPVDPHPFCQFCNVPYFSNDELYVHLTTEHKTCRFCEREGFQKYFRNAVSLFAHMKKFHFVCDHPACTVKVEDMVAFSDVLSLRAHTLQVHAEKDKMSRSQLKSLTTLDINMLAGPSSAVPSRSRGARSTYEYDMSDYESESKSSSSYDDVDEDSVMFSRTSGSRPSIAARIQDREQFPSLASDSSSDSKTRTPQAPEGTANAAYSRLSGADNSLENFPALPTSSAPKKNTAAYFTQQSKRTKQPQQQRQQPQQSKQQVSHNKPAPKPLSASTPAFVPTSQPQPQAQVQSPSASSLPSSNSTFQKRTLSHIPLPLPDQVPAADAPLQNKVLFAKIKEILGSDQSKLDKFRESSSSYRSGSLSASEYLQIFEELMSSSSDSELLLMDLLALLPDQERRAALHAEYAKQKLMKHLQKSNSSWQTVSSEKTKKVEQPQKTQQQPKPQEEKKVATMTAAPTPQWTTSTPAATTSSDAADDVDSFPSLPASSTSSSSQAPKWKAKTTVKPPEPIKPPSVSVSSSSKGSSTVSSPQPNEDNFPTLSPMATSLPASTSSDFSASSSSSVPPPSVVAQHISNVANLQIPQKEQQQLEFFCQLLDDVCVELQQRHPPDFTDLQYKRYQLTTEKRNELRLIARKLAFAQLFEVSRFARLGLSLQNVQLLSSIFGLFARGDLESVGDWLKEAAAACSSQELFLLYEFVHQLLSALTSQQHPEIKRLTQLWQQQQARQQQNSVFDTVLNPSTTATIPSSTSAPSLRPLVKKDDEEFEFGGNRAAANRQQEEGSSSGHQKKKQNKKQILFRVGL